ncbi:MAG: hypothetical protein M5U12_20320 [Verrucomicrobia bacterium]|nr:hypothetical protein [Verrucomicrobiota bacterium]
MLRDYPWSSWRVYAGLEPAPTWLTVERIASGCGGRRPAEQRAALIHHTEQPIRQGRLDSPWEGMVAGTVLGDAAEAATLPGARGREPGGEGEPTRETAVDARPEWPAIVRAAESLLGRTWQEMTERYGDWGRDGTLAVATRHLGWRLAEVVGQVAGVNYDAAAQGIRRFWRQAETHPERARFAHRLRDRMSTVNV